MANPHKSKSQSFLNKKHFFIFLFSQFCTPCSVVAVMDLFHQTLLYDWSTTLYEKLGRFNNKLFFIFVYCVVKTIQLLLDLTCEENKLENLVWAVYLFNQKSLRKATKSCSLNKFIQFTKNAVQTSHRFYFTLLTTKITHVRVIFSK